MTQAQVRALLGPPPKVKHGSSDFGPYTRFTYPRVTVMFQGNAKVTSVWTQSPAEKTAGRPRREHEHPGEHRAEGHCDQDREPACRHALLRRDGGPRLERPVAELRDDEQAGRDERRPRVEAVVAGCEERRCVRGAEEDDPRRER